MSEIRNRIIKVLEESHISFMEDGDKIEPRVKFEHQYKPAELEEGWKDNLKKAGAMAAVAGGLMAGGAQAADRPVDFNDGAQADGQFTAYYQDDESPLATQLQAQRQDDIKNATVLPNGMIKDQYGNEWTEEEWEKLMNNEDPFEDNDNVVVDNESVMKEDGKQYGVQYRDMHTAIHNLILTDNKQKAEQILELLNKIEKADEQYAQLLWDKVNQLSNNSIEIDYRNVDADGMYDGIKVINAWDVKPDIWG